MATVVEDIKMVAEMRSAVEKRVNELTSDEELEMWDKMSVPDMVSRLVLQQVKENTFHPIVVAKMQITWTWLQNQARAEMQLRREANYYRSRA